MGRINILQPGVFNMISAGEVVERPASVVKELVENSIDAGATDISVTVAEGGTRLIRVSDNGTGILKEDMRTAFLPHATSKLAEISDLDTIATLGFRGEALASIASVSRVTMVSHADGAETGCKIVLEAGKVTGESADSRAKGTSVTVEDLFFNTPARLKFLKKASTELGYIADTVEKIVLANPSLRITLESEKGVVLEHAGGDLRDAIASVYPNLDISRFIAVDRTASSGVRVTGFISEETMMFSRSARVLISLRYSETILIWKFPELVMSSFTRSEMIALEYIASFGMTRIQVTRTLSLLLRRAIGIMIGWPYLVKSPVPKVRTKSSYDSLLTNVLSMPWPPIKIARALIPLGSTRLSLVRIVLSLVTLITCECFHSGTI